MRTHLIALITGLCLAYCLVAAGFACCCAPVTTQVLATQHSAWHLSAYTQDQLVALAQTTRAYTVEGISTDALYEAIGTCALTLSDAQVKAEAGKSASIAGMDAQTAARYLAARCDTLSLPADAVSHLDSVHQVAICALWALVICAAIAAAGIAWLARRRLPALTEEDGRNAAPVSLRTLSNTLIAASAFVLALFALCLGACLIDFDRFFNSLHALFFSQGTWLFNVDSLLICLYPDLFWVGMGIVWVTVTALLSIAALIVGLRIRRNR